MKEIIPLNEDEVKSELREKVRKSVDDTLNTTKRMKALRSFVFVCSCAGDGAVIFQPQMKGVAAYN